MTTSPRSTPGRHPILREAPRARRERLYGPPGLPDPEDLYPLAPGDRGPEPQPPCRPQHQNPSDVARGRPRTNCGRCSRCCPPTSVGVRDRTLILVMADADLRAARGGAPPDRRLEPAGPQPVRAQRQGPEGPRVICGRPTTTRAIRDYLATRPSSAVSSGSSPTCSDGRYAELPHPDPTPASRPCGAAGDPSPSPARPPALADLVAPQRCGTRPGAAATRAREPTPTLRYSNLVAADLQQAHKNAGAIERVGVDAARV